MEDTDMLPIKRALNGGDRVIVGGDTLLRLGFDRIKGCMISGNEMYTIDFKNNNICTFDERFGSDTAVSLSIGPDNQLKVMS